MVNKDLELTTLTGNPDLIRSGFDNPPVNPLDLFQRWLETADRLKIVEPRGFILSTIDSSGKPSSRVILLRNLDENGVIFASSETSQKGRDLSTNPLAAGTLWWRETLQQINFFGRTNVLSVEMSDAIFRERTREAQAVTVLSAQSTPMVSEKKLQDAIATFMKQPGEIVRPNAWHAYHIFLERIEFWHGGRNRFHQRLRYDLENGIWHHQKLQP